ncbi:MAG: fused MFS/spermidine synthase [Chloroflexi bacterium]|nr:fused MFS/spermidine synthase [Chloroflexota bacterium]
MTFFALSVFLSAFLLFQVQPMIGKFILPWFGGTPAVWSTAMLFFQVFLTGGYAYAYWLVKQRRQGWIHSALLAATVVWLVVLGFFWKSPVTPSVEWKPDIGVSLPILQLFFLLTVSVGLPYFVLASNSPLMQAWFSRLFPRRSYAKLYSLSNVGSLMGLLAYPILIEPQLTLRVQGWVWSGGFILFAMLVGWSALRAQRADTPADGQPAFPSSAAEKPSAALMSLWAILGAIPSVFLLAVTNHITQEVAVIPFLWIIPLALYLLSFILTFSGGVWIQPRLYALLFAAASVAALWALGNAATLSVFLQIFIYSALLFFACMSAHGELYLLRPPAEHLTAFYLMVSVGGALGGIFVNLIAPLIFTGYWEFYLAWLMTFVILILSLLPRWERPKIRASVLWVSFLAGTLAIVFSLNSFFDALAAHRNFYGLMRVRSWTSPNGFGDGYLMIHGMTVHGIQYLSPELRDEPTTHFTRESGAGLLLSNHPQRGHGMKVGVLGLGIGTLAAYAEASDIYRFYEINPIVVEYAEGRGGYFSFLSDCKGEVAVITDDARLALERELARGEPQNFDVLILDTFSSDSIPTHLITREAFAIYLQHLKPDGVLAAHISNRHINLLPVLWGLSQEYGLSIVVVDRNPKPGEDIFPSRWVLMAVNPQSLQIPEIQERAVVVDESVGAVRLWTDDYSNLFQILK